MRLTELLNQDEQPHMDLSSSTSSSSSSSDSSSSSSSKNLKTFSSASTSSSFESSGRKVTFHKDITTAIHEIPKWDNVMIPRLFYSKFDIKRFQEKAKIKAQKDYDKQMRAQVQDMVRQVMSEQIEAARARGATEEEIEDMLPKTPQEMLKVLGNAPADMIAPPKVTIPKDDVDVSRRPVVRNVQNEKSKKKEKATKKRKTKAKSFSKNDSGGEIMEDDIFSAFDVHSEESMRRIKDSVFSDETIQTPPARPLVLETIEKDEISDIKSTKQSRDKSRKVPKNHDDDLSDSQHDIINEILGTSFSEMVGFESLLPDVPDVIENEIKIHELSIQSSTDDSDSDFSLENDKSQIVKRSSKRGTKSVQEKPSDGTSWERILARSIGISSQKPEAKAMDVNDNRDSKSTGSKMKKIESKDEESTKSSKSRRKSTDSSSVGSGKSLRNRRKSDEANDTGSVRSSQSRKSQRRSTTNNLSPKRTSRHSSVKQRDKDLTALSAGSGDETASRASRRSRRKGKTRESELSKEYGSIECTLEYFEMLLDKAKKRCQQNLKVIDEDTMEFEKACQEFYATWNTRRECEQGIDHILQKNGSVKEYKHMDSSINEANRVLPQLEENCLQKASTIVKKLDLNQLLDFEIDLVRGAIIAEATPKSLAYFAEGSIENESLLKRLFTNLDLMKDMLEHGSPSTYNYGNAMKIYTECIKATESQNDKFRKVNRKIALACALEFASPKTEFDSVIEIDPVARFKYFEMAHYNGDLDPEFPHFSVWEMRHVVNCDAPNAQMTWCRETVMNYAPHYTCITTEKLRYVYMLDVDVRTRNAKWTESPKTYERILSEGASLSAKSCFGKFMLQSFGLPVWGSRYRGREGFMRWTSEGWEAMNGADWKTGRWNGREGHSFKEEIQARKKAPSGEYFKNVILLECLAEILDEPQGFDPNEGKDCFHPDRFWRSLSLFSRFRLAIKEESKVSKRKSLVNTKCEKYLDDYQNDAPEGDISIDEEAGTVIFPASRYELYTGNVIEIESFGGGKQLNFLADGVVEYRVPDSLPSKKYRLSFDVCTVSGKQSPLMLKICEGEIVQHEILIKIPYTSGRWETVETTDIEAKGNSILRFSRGEKSVGMALKKVVLS